MQPIILTLKQIRKDYPQFTFKKANVSRWSPADATIFYSSLSSDPAKKTLLHELGHALNGHKTYHQDIELLRLEREAWQTARDIAPVYGLEISEDEIVQALSTYREWIYKRSSCPSCQHNGIQSSLDNHYQCLLCGCRWSANDARQCGLKRYVVTPK